MTNELRYLPANMTLNLDEAVQDRGSRGDGSEGAHSAGRAGIHSVEVGVVFQVDDISANLEGQRLFLDVESEVAHQAGAQHAEVRIADAIDVQRHDARLVRSGLHGGPLFPALGAGLAER